MSPTREHGCPERLDGLPQGVEWRRLTAHVDDRGSFSEIFREEWGLAPGLVQWNMVRSDAGVLRGVHVHRYHTDYLVLAAGRATVGLHDLRRSSASTGRTAIVQMGEDSPACLVIPPGVAHGFLFHEASIHVYAVTRYWSPRDEFGCHWSDPALDISWPNLGRAVHISERDASLPSLRELRLEVQQW